MTASTPGVLSILCPPLALSHPPSILHKVAQVVKSPLAMRETQVWFLGWEDLLEKKMATNSTLLAWRTPWTEEPGGLHSMGSQRVGQDFTFTFTFTLVFQDGFLSYSNLSKMPENKKKWCHANFCCGTSSSQPFTSHASWVYSSGSKKIQVFWAFRNLYIEILHKWLTIKQ